MAIGERQEREVLERARRALGPDPGALARIRQGVNAALAAPAPLTVSGEGSEAASGVASTAQAVGATSWSTKLAGIIAVAAAGGLGYVAGHRAGLAEGSTRVPPPAIPVTSVAAPTFSAETPAPSPTPVTPVPEKPSQARSAQAVAVPPAAPASAASSRAAVDEEVIQLRRVQRALREGNARLALALLDDLNRTVPHGRLGEERAAADAIGRCTLGVGPPAVLLADFAAKYPNSVHSVRVDQACRAGHDE